MATTLKCEELDLAAYVDGELAELHVSSTEEHLADCAGCRDELNFQKQMLRMLDGGLKREAEIELPKDFAKLVVKKAENNVTGLRPAAERFNAVFVIAGLSLAALFAIGTESAFFGGLNAMFEQVSAVTGFFAQTAYSFLLGVFVIVRSASSVFSAGTGPSFIASIVCVAAVLLSIRFLRVRRV